VNDPNAPNSNSCARCAPRPEVPHASATPRTASVRTDRLLL